jgi:hypothetical protein
MHEPDCESAPPGITDWSAIIAQAACEKNQTFLPTGPEFVRPIIR